MIRIMKQALWSWSGQTPAIGPGGAAVMRSVVACCVLAVWSGLGQRWWVNGSRRDADKTVGNVYLLRESHYISSGKGQNWGILTIWGKFGYTAQSKTKWIMIPLSNYQIYRGGLIPDPCPTWLQRHGVVPALGSLYYRGNSAPIRGLSLPLPRCGQLRAN